jgi:hypothetical protein
MCITADWQATGRETWYCSICTTQEGRASGFRIRCRTLPFLRIDSGMRASEAGKWKSPCRYVSQWVGRQTDRRPHKATDPTYHLQQLSRYSDQPTRCTTEESGFVSRQSQRFHIVQIDFATNTDSYPKDTENSFPGVKRPGCEADHSSPSSAEVTNARAYTFKDWI